MRGDYVELQVSRERVEDGQGGEREGIVVRVWGESDDWQESRDTILVGELRVPDHEPPPAFPPLRELLDHVLSTMEIE